QTVDDHACDEAEERERHELTEGEDSDGDRRGGQRQDEPCLSHALHPRPRDGDDLAGEKEPVVAVLADAEECSCAGAQDCGRHACSSSGGAISGSTATPLVPGGAPGGGTNRGLASGAVSHALPGAVVSEPL